MERFINNRKFQEDSKLFKDLRKTRVYCKCGHSVQMKPNREYIICTFCGRKIINPRFIFKDKLNAMLRESEDKKDGN